MTKRTGFTGFMNDRTGKTARQEPAVEYPMCQKCYGGGWMQVHSERPPAFDVCDVCYNPQGYPKP